VDIDYAPVDHRDEAGEPVQAVRGDPVARGFRKKSGAQRGSFPCKPFFFEDALQLGVERLKGDT
jgi:hypothetical protein